MKRDGVIAQDIPVSWASMCLAALIFSVYESVRAGDLAPNSAPDLVLRTFLNGLSVMNNVDGGVELNE